MTTGSASTDIIIGDRSFTFVENWDASPLTRRGYIALSTQAESPVSRQQAPELTLLAASAGDDANVLVTPDQVGEFILAHPQARYVFHDVGAQFWVVDHHLENRGEDEARRAWWDAAEENRMSDTMLLDQLIELAGQDAEPRDRSLMDIGRRYTRLDLSGDEPLARCSGEIGASSRPGS